MPRMQVRLASNILSLSPKTTKKETKPIASIHVSLLDRREFELAENFSVRPHELTLHVADESVAEHVGAKAELLLLHSLLD